jgi:nucleotide-binding universal stress UspA family protein
VLHHNLATVGPGFAKAWEWEAAHRKPLDVSPKGPPDETEEGRARRLMAEVLERIPATVTVEARISRGPVGLVLLYLIEEIQADLVILGSHGWTSEEHVSLCERLIESAPCPVLTFQEGRGEHAFRLHAEEGQPAGILVATDFSESATAALACACELARKADLRLHLLHVEAAKPAMVPVDSSQGVGMAGGADSSLERRLRKLVPEDLAARASCRVASGAVGDEILKAAAGVDAELIVMGEHARGFFRRYFTRDTAREMLHRAPCPVWYVPPAAA